MGTLGAIEGNVDKLVVRRLKGRGRSWSLDGAKAMIAVCRHQKELRQNAFKPFSQPEEEPKRKYQTKSPTRDDGEWLQAGVPALHLCHANRPWAVWLKEKTHPEGVL